MDLKKIQAKIDAFDRARGWDEFPASLVLSHLIEEIGEVSRYIQFEEGYKKKGIGHEYNVKELKREFAQVLALFMQLAIHYDIDLEEAVLEELEIMEGRFSKEEWKTYMEKYEPHYMIRDVVTAFLQHDGTILVLKRSGKVSTYKKRWAAISGTIEDETPLEAVYREIFEETKLKKEDIVLISGGTSVKVKEEDLRTIFYVHPFLFELENKKELKLNFEHTEYRWADKKELDTLETVPKLKEALMSCLKKISSD
ncbi:MAG: NUDIX domain-containing protein [Euryarchaeota archaeon]|nr:NUDIX domain-containing protein [Euryarchaeota archaeon]